MVKKLAVGYGDLIRQIQTRQEEMERIGRLKETTTTAALQLALNKAQRDLGEEIDQRKGILKRLIADHFWNDIYERITEEYKK